MASIEIVTLTDSLDPRISNGVETVTFFHPVFGTKHEIELSEKNREHFLNHLSKLDKYIDAAREIAVEVATPAKANASKNETTKIREWAKLNGFTIGDRGRIKAEIMDAYFAAQNAPVEDEKDEDHDSELAQAILATDPEELAESLEVVEQEDEREPLTDQDILDMMAQAEAEKGNVELSDLQAKVNN
jgi:nucleoid-associated protein Lsr2